MHLRLVVIVSALAALLAVFAGVARALDFDDEDPHPPHPEIGLIYHYEIGTHAGCIPHHVSILSGQLPPGLKLTQIGYQTALVDGIATEAGTFSAWLAVRDCDNRSAETLFTFDVWERRFGIDTKALPVASADSPYSSQLATWGIASNTTWAVTSGALPAGLTLSKEGVISGTATAAGSSTFTMQATGVAKDFTGTRLDSHQYTLNVTALTASLSRPVAEVGVPLRTALVASGGQAPYIWRATSVPAGLTLGSDGSLSGTPPEPGAYTLTAHLVDASGAAKDVTVRLVVRPRLAIATKALRAATAGHAYRAKLAVRGGVGTLVWSASLPRGLKLSRTGAITGLPASPGTFRLKVRVRDSLGATSTKTLLLAVH
jgi:putative Ig domain-containing protein